jgi:hypothetical protein
MDKINVHEAVDHDRRRFFGAAALTFAAAELDVIGAADAETKPAPPPVNNLGASTSFAPLKQIDAGVLNVGYAESGPPNGSPVILLHGWPYDIHCRPQLFAAQLRSIQVASRIAARTAKNSIQSPTLRRSI